MRRKGWTASVDASSEVVPKKFGITGLSNITRLSNITVFLK